MNGQIIPEETEKSIEVKQENATFLVIGDKAYTSEIIEEYNRNAEAKTEDFNTNAENKTASYNSNAVDRTTAFNNNYDDKITAFNSNANKQTEEFDSHVLMQTNTFNKNAVSTIANYNSNAEQKTTEFNQNALSYQERIDANKKHIIIVSNELERVKNDVLETGTDTDTYIHLEDSAMAEYQELSIDGVCEQETTSIADGDEYDSPSPDYPQPIKVIEKRLPSEYQEVEYIESTGTQYIDTGIKGSTLTNILVEYMLKSNGQIFGERDSWLNNEYGLSSSHTYFGTGYEYHEKDILNKKIVYKIKNKIFFMDNVITNNYNAIPYFISNSNIYLFAENSNGTSASFSSGILYKCSMTYDGVEVRNFIPCYRKSDNEMGLYDLVNNEFYTNQGTGTFLKGEDKDLIITSDNGSVENYLYSQIKANLPEGEFIGKIDDTYKDTLKVEYNEEDGQYHLILNKMLGKAVLNGSESWTLNEKGTGYIRYIFNKNNVISNPASNNICIISSHFEGSSAPNTINANADKNRICIATNKRILVKTIDDDLQSLDDFKTWLSTHNVEIYYALATPYTLDLGVVDMPITYNEITNLFTDSDLMPTINAKYYRNFITTVRNLQVNEKALMQELIDINARLSALESAQTSTTSESEVVE